MPYRPFPADVEKAALLSPCGLYHYTLRLPAGYASFRSLDLDRKDTTHA